MQQAEDVAPTGLADAFDRAARRYDLLTGLNPGYHRHLDAAARRLAERLASAPTLLLDLGCGSGSSTAALLRRLPPARVVGIDASAGMLAQAEAKRGNEDAMLGDIRAAIAAGGAGVAIGRNIFQAADPKAMTAAVAAIVHGTEPGA